VIGGPNGAGNALAMTELTPREILEAIRRGLEETARRFDNGRSDQVHGRPPAGSPTRDIGDQGFQIDRKA